MTEDLFRIGEKLVSLRKILERVEKILNMRSRGLSQQEVAAYFKLDRSFISRLENMGEIRKGRKIAILGFPLKNKEEIRKIAEDKGVDFIWLMNEEERWKLVEGKSALDFFNQVMDLITELISYDLVVLIASRKWLKLGEALLDGEIFFLELGESPITEDKELSPELFARVLEHLLL